MSRARPRRLILFAPGAGAPSSSAWMSAWAARLAAFGEVVRFDYPYARAGRRRPDPHATLVGAHGAALAAARAKVRGPVVLAGKSLGSRIGCHVALEVEAPVAALVCLGYPLVGQSGTRRDAVLVALRTPILFLQGTRDRLAPLGEFEAACDRMLAPHALHVVQSGDHSLLATRTWLRAHETTQDAVDADSAAAIGAFLDEHAPLGAGRGRR